jgi:hypothetical protein
LFADSANNGMQAQGHAMDANNSLVEKGGYSAASA